MFNPNNLSEFRCFATKAIADGKLAGLCPNKSFLLDMLDFICSVIVKAFVEGEDSIPQLHKTIGNVFLEALIEAGVEQPTLVTIE